MSTNNIRFRDKIEKKILNYKKVYNLFSLAIEKKS